MDKDIEKLIEREKENKWINLTKKSIQKALETSGLSFSPKNNLEGLGHHETDEYIWDLDILGTKTQGFTMTIRLSEMKRDSNNFLLTFRPYEIAPCESVAINKRPTHEEATKIINKYAKKWLSLMVEKGLHRVIQYADGDGWKEWRYGGKIPVKFRISYPIRGVGLEKEFGWIILQNPAPHVKPIYHR